MAPPRRAQPACPRPSAESSFGALPEPLRTAARERYRFGGLHDAAYQRFEEASVGRPDRERLRAVYLEAQAAYDAAVDRERLIRRAMGRDDPFGAHPERDDPHWRRNRRRKATT